MIQCKKMCFYKWIKNVISMTKSLAGGVFKSKGRFPLGLYFKVHRTNYTRIYFCGKQKYEYTMCPKKNVSNFDPYSEAVSTTMLRTSGFPVSLDLYNSFICLLSWPDEYLKWQWFISQTWICSKLGLYRTSLMSYSRRYRFQARLGILLVRPITLFSHITVYFQLMWKFFVSYRQNWLCCM